MPARSDVLKNYGLPDAPSFEFEAQRDAAQTTRVRVKHKGGTVSMSAGHLSSLAHELAPVDQGLAKQIQSFLKSGTRFE